MGNRPATAVNSHDDYIRWIGLGAVLIVALSLAACGKKAPPVAPQQTRLTAVSDLQARFDDGRVVLTWQHSSGNRRAAGYLVLRAQTAADQPPCPGCPQVFQKVGTLRLSRTQRDRDHTMTFDQDLASGFRYTYSIRPFHASGRQGPDSNLVNIDGLSSDSAPSEQGGP